MTERRSADRWGSTASFEESFRVLTANVRSSVAQLDEPSVMVTSAAAGEGRSTVCVKLGSVLATRGLRVVVIDLDLRDPSCHVLLGGTNDLGVTDVVLGRNRLDECLQRVPVAGDPGSGLYLLASGTGVEEPDELLGRPRARRLIERLAADADLVLVDTPPVLAVADSLTVGGMVRGALLVIDPRRSAAGPVERTRDLLRRNGTMVLGIVVNQVNASDAAAEGGGGYGLSSPPSP